MITPELKKKREVRLKTLMGKFQKKIKEMKKMINRTEKKQNDGIHLLSNVLNRSGFVNKDREKSKLFL